MILKVTSAASMGGSPTTVPSGDVFAATAVLAPPNALAIARLAYAAAAKVPSAGALDGVSGNEFAPAFGAPALGAPALGAPAFGAPAFGAPAFGAPAFGVAVAAV